MDCGLPGSSVHGICQARVLEWGAIAFIGVSGVIKSPTIIVLLSISPFMSVIVCLMFWSAPMLGAVEGNGTPLQYSCLENPMDVRAWKAAVHGVAEGRTRLSDFTFTFHFHALEKEVATHSSVLAWRIPRMGKPDGLLSMESHRVGHNWSDLAAAAAACTQHRGTSIHKTKTSRHKQRNWQ